MPALALMAVWLAQSSQWTLEYFPTEHEAEHVGCFGFIPGRTLTEMHWGE